MALFYIIQNLLSILIILKLKKYYGLISLTFFIIIFYYKRDTFDILFYTDIVDQTQNYEILFASIINIISYFIEQNRTVITVYQLLLLCLSGSILFFLPKNKNKILILAVIFSSVGVMLAVHNNLRQGTACIFILLGILSYFSGRKKTSIFFILSSFGFHESAILFVILYFMNFFIFSQLYKKIFLYDKNKQMMIIYFIAIFLSVCCSLLAYFLIYYIDYITITPTSYINYLRSVEYKDFRTTLSLKTLIISILLFASEFVMKLKVINFKIDFFRFFRISVLFFCFFISFFDNFSEIGNRILYFYYILDVGLLCLLISHKFYNVSVVILMGYAFAFNVWTIVGGI